MKDNVSQYDASNGSIEDLLEILPRARQVLKELATALQALPMNPSSASPCDTCTRADSCTEPCRHLNALLPGSYVGKIHGEETISLDFQCLRGTDASADVYEEEDGVKFNTDKLQSIRKVHSIDIFEPYVKCWGIFSNPQREVLILRHRDGRTMTEISEKVDKAVGTICGLLQRAEKRKREWEEKQLRTFLKFKREIDEFVRE